MPGQELSGDELLTFIIDDAWNIHVGVNSLIVFIAALVLATFVGARLLGIHRSGFKRFEIDEAQFGIGDQKLTLRPNDVDRQIAYQIWVELSTRKIGLPIDLNDDVIAEIYDSWYSFFAITRELIKDVPVSKFRRRDTEKIIRLSIDVLNTGLRPHLTKWQARYRHWYERVLKEKGDVSPQEIQKSFPEYEALKEDLEKVNQRLIGYRDKMYELVTNL